MPARTAIISSLLFALAFVIAASLIPFDLTAQTDTAGPTCPRLTRNLYLGLNDARTNGEVSKLQRFLTQTGDFTYGRITGYFGPLTEAAVQEWQCRNMQLCSGGPEENGWGVVGPRTRAVIARACNTQTPPSAPTCTLNANPSSITLGQSSILSWTSTNTTNAYIDSLGFVSTTGSQSVSPIQTTTYTGFFWREANLTTCNTTITVTASTTGASCTLDGVTVAHGESRTFYLTDIVSPGNSCSAVSQLRTCTNGVLSGSSTYSQASCRVAGSNDTTPVAEWKFDEASGSIALDSSGNGNSGILENGATRYVGTQQGNKLELDGVDDRMRVDTVSSNILNMGSFTVMAWVRPTEYAGVIMRKGNTETGRFNFGIRSDGVLYLRAGYSERTGSFQTTTPLPLNTWSHVAVSYSYGLTNKPTLYVNGVQQALRPSVANPGTYDPADPLGTPVADTPHLYIGNTHDFSNNSAAGFDSAFEGRMDIVRIYNAILSTSDIQAHYNENRVDDTPANTASCILDGVTVLHGQSRTFYSTNTVPWGQSCSSHSQSRTCTNGTLSGSSAYNKASCTAAGNNDTTSQNFSATPQSGSAPLAVTFTGSYEPRFFLPPGGKSKIRLIFGDGSAPVEQSCTTSYSIMRCVLSNVSHTYAAGAYTAKIAHVRYGPQENNYPPEIETGSEQIWSTTITAGSGGISCTHNGQTYANGQTRSETTQCPDQSSWPSGLPLPLPIVCLDLNQCTNGRWVSGSRWEFRPKPLPSWPGADAPSPSLSLLRWSGGITVMPVAGSAPLTVEVKSDITFPAVSNSFFPPTTPPSYKLRVSFGDTSFGVSLGGSAAEQSCEVVTADTPLGGLPQVQCKLDTVHTYTSAYPPRSWPESSPPDFPGYPVEVQLLSGSGYAPNTVFKKALGTLWKGSIIVTSGTQGNSGASLQLANALTALEEALKGLLNYLTQ